MDPIAFRILGLDIRWYGILIASGMLLGILLAKYTCKIKEVNYDLFLNAIFISIPAGVIGARLYYVLFELDYYKSNLWQIFDIRGGGLAIHGGIIFGIISAIIYTRYKKLDFLKMADAASPSIILAQAIGRWGNFFNQEAHGGPVSYEFIKQFPEFIQKGMYINGEYYHPTFLYESAWNILVFIILMVILKRSRKRGIVLYSYIGLYSIGRFYIEGLRTDSLMIGPLRTAQIASIIGILLWLGSLVYYYSKKRTI